MLILLFEGLVRDISSNAAEVYMIESLCFRTTPMFSFMWFPYLVIVYFYASDLPKHGNVEAMVLSRKPSWCDSTPQAPAADSYHTPYLL
jgi:hypothetical protein